MDVVASQKKQSSAAYESRYLSKGMGPNLEADAESPRRLVFGALVLREGNRIVQMFELVVVSLHTGLLLLLTVQRKSRPGAVREQCRLCLVSTRLTTIRSTTRLMIRWLVRCAGQRWDATV